MAKATTNNKKKEASSAKKLVPAVGMFAVSAIMLSTATYAWFTMSKDAQVTGLTMSATTSDGLEISLGELYSTRPTGTDATTGKVTGGTVASYDSVTKAEKLVPSIETPCKDSLSWSSAINFAQYYDVVGKLMPASSSTGLTMYYVDNEKVVGGGTSVQEGAEIYAATWMDTSDVVGSTYTTSQGKSSTDKATNGESDKTEADTCNAVLELADNTANSTITTRETGDKVDDSNKATGTFSGYYVDIPMWIRSSSTETNKGDSEGANAGLNVYCAVKITDPTDNKITKESTDTTASDLVKAVRVAIIPMGDSSKQAEESNGTETNKTPGITLGASYEDSTSKGTIKLGSNSESKGLGTSGTSENVTIFGLNSETYRKAQVSGTDKDNGAIASASTKDEDGTVTGDYGIEKLAEQTVAKAIGSDTTLTDLTSTDSSGNTIKYNTAVFTLPQATSGDYAVQAFVVRIWIEGESIYCNDTTANQDWNIDMFFSADMSDQVYTGTDAKNSTTVSVSGTGIKAAANAVNYTTTATTTTATSTQEGSTEAEGGS